MLGVLGSAPMAHFTPPYTRGQAQANHRAHPKRTHMAHRTNIPTKWTLEEPPGTGLKAPMASGKGRDSEEEREVYKKAEERHWMIYGNPKKHSLRWMDKCISTGTCPPRPAGARVDI